jgi:hypothetical protein
LNYDIVHVDMRSPSADLSLSPQHTAGALMGVTITGGFLRRFPSPLIKIFGAF